jgi:hypothetical protein
MVTWEDKVHTDAREIYIEGWRRKEPSASETMECADWKATQKKRKEVGHLTHFATALAWRKTKKVFI